MADHGGGEGDGTPLQSPIRWRRPEFGINVNEDTDTERLGCLRGQATFPVFRWVLCSAVFFHGYIVNGLISTSVTTIEKKFDLSSMSVGMYTVVYDTFFILGLLLLLLLSKGVNKARIIGGGMMLVAMGSFMLASLHFISGSYISSYIQYYCQSEGRNLINECSKQDSHFDTIHMLMLSSMILLGFGAAPLFTYGFTCLADFDSQKNLGRNTAFLIGASILGPAIGYASSSPLLNTWGEFYRSSYEEFGISGTSDAGWYGPWYIGFIIGGLFSIVVATILCCFPKTLNDTLDRTREQAAIFDVFLNTEPGESSYERLRVFWLFLTNKTCMGLVVMLTLQSFIISGYSTFLPKLFENLLGTTAAQGGVWTGVLIVSTGLVGTMIGSQLFHYLYKFSSHNFRKLFCIAIGGIFICIVGATFLFFHCPTTKFAGINAPYRDGETNITLVNQCNIMCCCDIRMYDPICDVDSATTYYSPCYAGCKFEYKWTQCSCIDGESKNIKKGFCEPDCGNIRLFFFLGLFSILVLMIFIIMPIVQSATMQIAPKHLRDDFQSFCWFFMRLLGSIPGTILFGRLLDSTCLIWNHGCSGKASCHFYDSDEMGLILFFLTLAIEVFSIFSLVLVIFSYTSALAVFQDHVALLNLGSASGVIREIEYQSDDEEEHGEVRDLAESMSGTGTENESSVSIYLNTTWSNSGDLISPTRDLNSPYSIRRNMYGFSQSQRSFRSYTQSVPNISTTMPTVRRAQSDDGLHEVKKATTRSTSTRCTSTQAMKTFDDTDIKQKTSPKSAPPATPTSRRVGRFIVSDASSTTSVSKKTTSKKDN